MTAQTPEIPPTPVPEGRELTQSEVLAVANEIMLEAALKRRNAGRVDDTVQQWHLRREAGLLETWAFRLTQALA